KIFLTNLCNASRRPITLAAIAVSIVTGCGGGSDGLSGIGSCAFSVSDQPQSLTAQEVEKLLAQGAEAANKLGTKATISVVDRAGNVLAVYRMTGANTTVDILSGSGKNFAASPQGLDGLSNLIGSDLAAIAKAVTGSYLSSSGNAFSSRTASFIIQEHFVPGITQTASGPLYGVQFSQLPCGDMVTRGAAIGVGPKRSPLGLSADPGGFPLYKNGRVVGGIGVVADGVYGLDLDPTTSGADLDERIALSASKGFTAPSCIRADRITAGGITLAYSNSDAQIVAVSATSLSDPQVSTLGALLAVSNYYAGGTVLAGTAYGDPASGFAPDASTFSASHGYLVLTAGSANRYPPAASTLPTPIGSGGSGMTSAEVTEILQQALGVANQTRAQIRRPVGAQAEVTISVVDADGNVLGVVRTPDAPVFGTDVSLQKARTVAFFSSSGAAASLTALPAVGYFNGALVQGALFNLDSYLSTPVTGARDFFGNSGIFSDGTAFSTRSIANISRPYFPDGIEGTPNGPFSKPIANSSVFNVGLQLDLIYPSFITSILTPADPNTNCTGATGIAGLKNGAQIFPGGFPIYRGSVLIGGIGVSGDGVDQDDMIAMLGLSRASTSLNSGIAHAPAATRADNLVPQGKRLRYAQCPQAPFNNSNAQNVCDGI
ncbi:MAG: heme-binding protein, partial [Burkholderiaceae bacterium]